MSFDVEDVCKLTTEMTLRLDACDNGVATECAGLDQSLWQYARACCDFVAHVRKWAQDVFSGKVAFDPQVEGEWLDGGRRLYHRALTMWERTAKAGVPSYALPEHRAFDASLRQLQRILTAWVSPKLSVAPSARNPLPPEIVAEAQRHVAQLPLLPES